MAIEDYSFGRITVDGETYNSDVIIYPDRVDDSWWRQEGHVLQEADLQEVLDADPDVLIVGTGAYGRMRVSQAVENMLQQQGIELIAAGTEDACERYNEVAGARRTVAALHLTC